MPPGRCSAPPPSSRVLSFPAKNGLCTSLVTLFLPLYFPFSLPLPRRESLSPPFIKALRESFSTAVQLFTPSKSGSSEKKKRKEKPTVLSQTEHFERRKKKVLL